MKREDGINGQAVISACPHQGDICLKKSALRRSVSRDREVQVFVFRGRKGDRIKVLWWSGDEMCLLAKPLEHGHFVWPSAESGSVHLTPAQLSMLLEGIDWRRPTRTHKPTRV